jgi:Domain of unknown function (DUF1789).
MAKIQLTPNPTFAAPVLIPVHEGEPVAVSFTFKHRSNPELVAYVRDELESKTDVDVVMDVASAWELDDEFNAENVARLIDNYGGSAKAVWNTYLRVLNGERAKN